MDKHRRWVRPQSPRPKAVTAACATKSETTANLGIYTARGVANVTAADCWSRGDTTRGRHLCGGSIGPIQDAFFAYSLPKADGWLFASARGSSGYKSKIKPISSLFF
ncbi:MAG TPA: hypothetical protein DIU09_06585 [Hyphomonadaceae bacterium]|nr:hypothetical protein AEM38_15360 [Hyphomonadaceae bacterium UKL13-1]HCP64238.1 hypothetical protein [Hyphomonadaceae bacterium]